MLLDLTRYAMTEAARRNKGASGANQMLGTRLGGPLLTRSRRCVLSTARPLFCPFWTANHRALAQSGRQDAVTRSEGEWIKADFSGNGTLDESEILSPLLIKLWKSPVKGVPPSE